MQGDYVKKMEILAPAGHLDALIGAINAGAHAVYLAGSKFGARAYASNFDQQELVDAIHYAHVRGVFVYVTINTLIYNDEIDDLLTYTDFLVEHHVDAFIIQDLGVMYLLRKRYPNMQLHVSTQANAHSIDQVRFFKDIGMNRVVMARETPIEVIKDIKKEVDIELEVFVHGALCVCYSGNCLMSSMQGGRSGNRGECAQPCRLPYTLLQNDKVVSKESYLLSTKDLMTIDYLKDLMEIGVDSIKIEGRMRKASYVIQAVKSYDIALKNLMMEKTTDLEVEKQNLMKVFNRRFTKGYVFHEPKNDINHDVRPNHMGIEIGTVIAYQSHQITIKLRELLQVGDGYRILDKHDIGDTVSRIGLKNHFVQQAHPGDLITLDVKSRVSLGSTVVKTSDAHLENELSSYLDPYYKLISLDATIEAYAHQPFKLILYDGVHRVSVSTKDVLEKAVNQPLTKEQMILQISKYGETPFVLSSIDVKTNEDIFISLSRLNQLRREAISKLTTLRTKRDQQAIIKHPNFEAIVIPKHHISTVFKVTQQDQYVYLKDLGTYVYIEERLTPELTNDQALYTYRIQSPRIQHKQEPLVIHEVGTLFRYQHKLSLTTSEYVNVTNIYTAYLLHRYGVSRITLSLELQRQRVLAFSKQYELVFKHKPELEFVVYGKTELMISKYCPIAKTFKSKENCLLCEKNKYSLRDTLNRKLPLVHDGQCNIRILNHLPLELFTYIKEIRLAGIQTLRLDFTTETDEEMSKIIHTYQESNLTNRHHSLPQTTTGRYLK